MAEGALLVSSVGTGGETGYSETTYSLEGVGDCETNLCPLALADLLDFDAAFVPRTEEAAVYDEDLTDGFDAMGVDCAFETIPKIGARDDADVVLDTIITHIRAIDPASVVLDITHAYRSLPMVLFSSVMYLDALGEVDVEGIYYGEYQGEHSTLIDLTYLHTLMEWHHALRTFDTTGSLRAVHQLMESRKRQLFESDERPHDLAALVGPLGSASRHFDSGLPLEAGRATKSATEALEAVDEDQFVGPEGGFLAPLAEELRGFGLRQDAGTKADIRLDEDELDRQRAFVEFYRDTERYWLALECAREVFINRLLYEYGGQYRQNWLDRDTREEVRERSLTDEHRADRHVDADAIKLWDCIGQYRNTYAHSGFKRRDAPDEASVRATLSELCESLTDDAFWEEIV
jgi:hypothetical protein